MLLSATSASKHPKDNFDFFPLTVDVEERSYAAGKIPGSFFRREGRPSTEAILVCRLIDRPLRPSFVEGLRNEVQIVITVLSIAPDEFYDALAINAASASTQISGLPFSGPIAGVRLALIPATAHRPVGRVPEGRAARGGRLRPHRRRPRRHRRRRQRGRRDHDGRGRGHRDAAGTSSRRGATKPNEEVVAQGLEAVQAVPQAARRGAGVARRAGRQGDPRVPGVPALHAADLRRRRRPRLRRPEGRLPDRRQDRAPERRRRPQGRASRPPSPRRSTAASSPAVGPRPGLRRVQVGHEEGRARPHPHARASASTAAA